MRTAQDFFSGISGYSLRATLESPEYHKTQSVLMRKLSLTEGKDDRQFSENRGRIEISLTALSWLTWSGCCCLYYILPCQDTGCLSPSLPPTTLYLLLSPIPQK